MLCTLPFIPVQAFNCVETFPNKIIELNDFANEYMPESVKNSKYNENPVERKTKCQSTLSTVKNCDLNSISDFGGNYLSIGAKGIRVRVNRQISLLHRIL